MYYDKFHILQVRDLNIYVNSFIIRQYKTLSVQIYNRNNDSAVLSAEPVRPPHIDFLIPLEAESLEILTQQKRFVCHFSLELWLTKWDRELAERSASSIIIKFNKFTLNMRLLKAIGYCFIVFLLIFANDSVCGRIVIYWNKSDTEEVMLINQSNIIRAPPNCPPGMRADKKNRCRKVI